MAEASDPDEGGKGFFGGRSVAFWTVLGSVATVLSLLVTILTLLAPRASAPAQQQGTAAQIHPGGHTPRLAGSITVAASPSSLAMAPDGRHVYVTHSSGTMSVIDTATNTVTDSIDIGYGALGIAITPDGRHAYVAHWASATLSVIDTATNTTSATVNVGRAQWDVNVTPDGRWIYVTNRGFGTV